MQRKNAAHLAAYEAEYNSNIADIQSRNRAHVEKLEADHRKDMQELQDLYRNKFNEERAKAAELQKQMDKTYRSSIDQKDRDFQAAANKYAADLNARDIKHQEEVTRLLTLNS